MKRTGIRVCSFEAVDLPRSPRARHSAEISPALSYEEFRARVLEAGRFSSFEASETRRRARLFDRLCKDPLVVVTPIGFPWLTVRRKE